MTSRLYLANAATGVTVSGMDEKGERKIGRLRLSVGRASDCDVVVSGCIIGGRKNFDIEVTDDGAFLSHYSYHVPFLLNGHPVPANRHLIFDGDRLEPVDAGTGKPAVTFVFRS